jgi:hypothetical protein
MAATLAIRWRWVAGLNASDQLIVNPPDSLVSGTPVKIAEPDNN